MTTLLQAQRDAAWGEVARRLAHEIKNPLTPIQLSAERLRHKYLPAMAGQDARLLDRSTHTIIQQVEVMKELVKAFSEYARSPHLNLRLQNLRTVIFEVCELYRNDVSGIRFQLDIDDALPKVVFDAGRIRQLLHNLIKNAREAAADDDGCLITLSCHSIHDSAGDADLVELHIHDNGPGIPDEMIDQVFEPYVTGKLKGSGLGLPIVKKIVEEHGGHIWVENSHHSGACFIIRLPLQGGTQTADSNGRHKHRIET